MALEIEHKYLVISDEYRTMSYDRVRIRQGYLNRRPEGTVRVRIKGTKAYLTVKGRTSGDTRLEFEYEVPVHEAEQMLQMCEGTVIDKTRYLVKYEGHTWEVDEFHGLRQGLVVAEIELDASRHDYLLPPFVGKEVTGDPRYYNSNL